jgi:hypothetical protein
MATFTASTRMDSRTGKVQWQARFVSLPHALLTHPTYSELSGGASKLLLAMLSGYVGKNNGHLTATFSRMKTFGFNSKDSLARAIRELIAFGYIVRTKSQHLRSPALYAITWFPINKAPPGQPYDLGPTPGDDARDEWRDIDPWDSKRAA